MLRVAWQPHVDYVRAVGAPAPADVGFIQNNNRWWRPGWWAIQQPTRGGGQRTIADAEASARSWPQPWADDFHLTRVDVACDVVFTHEANGPRGFTSAHRDFFTCRGARQIIEKNHQLRTLYIGSRLSPIMLRIYLKSAHCTERDRERWRENGWNSRDDVWRIEYEFHRRALPADVELPRDTLRLWADGLARIRMCAVPPNTYNQQNQAPTHPWWKALGNPRKMTRRVADLAAPAASTVRELMLALDRLTVRGGAGIIEPMMARLLRQQLLTKGKRKDEWKE